MCQVRIEPNHSVYQSAGRSTPLPVALRWRRRPHPPATNFVRRALDVLEDAEPKALVDR